MKTIVVCRSCARQYALTGYEPGGKLRCACGEVLEVPDHPGLDAPVLHCASCGAPVAEDWGRCEYCASPIDRKSSLNTLVCPGCFSRIPQDASYCTHCGLPIRPQVVSDACGDQVLLCPRCDEGKLVARDVEGRHFFECPSCCGIFLERQAFSEIVDDMSRRFEKDPMPADRAAPGRLDKVVYLRCPVCGEFMARRNYAKRSGVIVDECREHGLWLDDGELKRIAAFVARGGLVESRRAEAEEAARLADQKRRISVMSLPDHSISGQGAGSSFLDWIIRSILD